MLRESLSDLWHAKDCWTIELYRPGLRFHWRYRVHSVRSDHQRGTSNYDGFAAAGRYAGSTLFAGSYCQRRNRALLLGVNCRRFARRAQPGLRQAPPPNVCLIDGTPKATGTSNFTILVQDSYGETNSAQFALTVSPPPPITITPASPLPSGDVGALYSENLSVSGGTGSGY